MDPSAKLTRRAPEPAWPRFLLDLTLWHSWHAEHGTIPDIWKGKDPRSICGSLGVPAWDTVKPWRVELPGVIVHDTREPAERTIVWEAGDGTLTSRWTLGPDGDWWHTEYPVKAASDLKTALAVARARRYVLAPAAAEYAPDGELPALELPLRPWSDLFHSFLGWSEGLMILMEEPLAVREISLALESAFARLVREIVTLPGRIIFSPDNLDGQFVTPEAFAENLSPSYRLTTDAAHAQGKALVVHVGGPVRRLLPGLADCGIDCVEGICGAPQGDTSLAEARTACGPHIALWGGIPQDFLLADHTDEEFVHAAEAAFDQAEIDPGAIVGVADRVPVNAVPHRLETLARMAKERFGGLTPLPKAR